MSSIENDRRCQYNKFNKDDIITYEERKNIIIHYDYAKFDVNLIEINNMSSGKKLLEKCSTDIKRFDPFNKSNKLETPSEIQKKNVKLIIDARILAMSASLGSDIAADFPINTFKKIIEGEILVDQSCCGTGANVDFRINDVE